MTKQRKPLSTKNPPLPNSDHAVITDWMEGKIMPTVKPIVTEIDSIIRKFYPEAYFNIKWGSAFYGTEEQGWIIEVAAYAVSVNVVFLNGTHFTPQPPLGDGDQTRYLKLNSVEDIQDPKVLDWISQAGKFEGWK